MMYQEIPGKSCPAGSEAETLSAVRSALLSVEEEQPKRRSLFGGRTSGRMVAKPVASKARVSKAFLFDPLPCADADEPVTKGPGLLSRLRLSDRLGALQARAPRIQRKHLALGALVLLCVIKPLWILAVLALVAFLITAAFLLIGADKIWRGVMLALHQLSDKDPARAIRIRKRLDGFAMKWDAFLDRFPEGAVDGLYMPDFQVLSEEEARNEARFVQRMERLREQG